MGEQKIQVIEATGKWNIIGFDEEQEIFGELNYSLKGAILKLFLNDLYDEIKGMSFDIITGKTNSGDFSLLFCTILKNGTYHGTNFVEIIVGTVIEGHRYDRLDDIKFTEAWITHDILERNRWIFDFNALKTDYNREENAYTCKYIKPKPIPIYSNDGKKINLEYFPDTIESPGYNYSIQQKHKIKIKYSEPQKYMDIYKDIEKIMRFFSFIMQRNCIIYKFHCTNPSILITPSDKKLQTITIHLPDQYTYNNSLIQENRDPLFHFNMISRNLEEIYQKWSELYTLCELEISFYLYSFLVSFEMEGVKFVGNYDLIAQFLDLIYGLESFHRKIGKKNLYMSEDKYVKNVLPLLIQALPPDLKSSHRDSLKSRLKYGNGFSLRKRISDLIDLLPPQELNILGIGKTKKHKFVSKIVGLRNRLVHGKFLLNDTSIDELLDNFRISRKLFLSCLKFKLGLCGS